MNKSDASKKSRERISIRARLRPKAQLTLPEDIRRALRVSEGDEVEFTVHQNGLITLRGYVSVPTDQAWFFTSEFQAERRRADQEMEAEGGTVHMSAEAMFFHLDNKDEADR
jgi:antitoxin PrlF